MPKIRQTEIIESSFEDLDFEPHPNWSKLPPALLDRFPEYSTARQARLDFDNGWGVSVLSGYGCYGSEEGLYELAVMHGGHLHYSNPVACGDVRGHLTQAEVSNLMVLVQQYCADAEFVSSKYAEEHADSND